MEEKNSLYTRDEMHTEDGRLILQVSPDKMEVYVSIFPPLGNGKAIQINDVREALQKEKITQGILMDEIEKVVQDGNCKRVLIARGESPQKGENALFHFHFQQNQNTKPQMREDGSVDYKQLHTVYDVKMGSILITKTPAKPGQEGINVYGQNIKALSGQDIRLPQGKNTVVSQDGLQLIASCDGQVKINKNGKVEINPVLELEDVDYSTGNIDFIGSVIVKGRISDGFEVKAVENIEVYGIVGAARLQAGKNVILHRGLAGKDKGTVLAGKSIFARFIENGILQAGENIEIDEAVMHSYLMAEGEIKIDGKKGLIVGGRAQAGKLISAKTIGSEFATRTIVEVGVKPKLRDEISNAEKEKTLCEDNLDKTDKAINLLKGIVDRGGKLPPDKEELLRKLLVTHQELQKKQKELVVLTNHLQKEMVDSKHGKIIAKLIIYPGVVVTIGSASLPVRDVWKSLVFELEQGEIHKETY